MARRGCGSKPARTIDGPKRHPRRAEFFALPKWAVLHAPSLRARIGHVPFRNAFDWLVGSVSRSRGEALGAAGVFSTFGFGRKVCWAYFLSRKRSLSRATRGRRPGRERAARNETEQKSPIKMPIQKPTLTSS